MYDPTFNHASLGQHLRKSDFRKHPELRMDSHRDTVVARAVATAQSGFTSLPMTENDLAGRKIYQINDLASDLVLRKTAQNVRRITGSRQSSRMEIIRRLKLLCEEGMPFSVAKMDVRNFYPSIDQNELLGQIKRRLVTAPSTRFVLGSLIDQCKRNSVVGLAPGLAISAELSEFYMQDFDRNIREASGAHYFARYVDDIILVVPELDSSRRMEKLVADTLPKGLGLNFTKSKVFVYGSAKVNSPAIEHSFDYLGFQFNVYQTNRRKPCFRLVKLDISPSKIRKIKTRIVKSFLQFLSDGIFDDLRDRIRILTCGYQFFDERQQKKRNAGIQHTYKLVGSAAPALIELDKFLKSMVLCRSGAICGRLDLSLANCDRKELLKHSFVKGFANRVHFRFSGERLASLMECWKYV